MKELPIKWGKDSTGRPIARVMCPAARMAKVVHVACPGCAFWRGYTYKYADRHHPPDTLGIILVQHDGALATHVRCAAADQPPLATTIKQAHRIQVLERVAERACGELVVLRDMKIATHDLFSMYADDAERELERSKEVTE